ncbi:hypothetical protein AUP74_01681 [Microbulbifer aggregans]|uniref:Ribosomal protein L7/L12 C-terminal domain-containing protein n=1 Tax=Microbulbifer aggregans TaxID=1769779 RepID=A0A1C9W7I5_9GAMM|nr:hypothetical protein [Microbulbifer aggregans]AOS97112.1 hypothetical protein AUP74_01681 [Microbulbifer aggregans]
MSELRYSVIFRGDLEPGFTANDVRANLARLFKASPETIEKLFSGRPLAIKKNLGEAQARQLQATLAKMGAQVTLKAEGEPAPAAVPPSPEPEPAAESRMTDSGPDWSLAPMEGNLVKDHEREKKEAVQVEVNHLSLKPAGGNLVEDTERERTPGATVAAPDWQLD